MPTCTPSQRGTEPRDRQTDGAVPTEASFQREDDDDPRLAYRQFIQLADDLAAVDPVTKVLLSAEEPDVTGRRWDDAVAALSNTVCPKWEPRCLAGSPTVGGPQTNRGSHSAGSAPLPFAADVTAVAEPFLRRGVLIEENELESA